MKQERQENHVIDKAIEGQQKLDDLNDRLFETLRKKEEEMEATIAKREK